MMVVSDQMFRLLASAITGGFAGFLAIYDGVRIARLRGAGRDRQIADQRFGYLVGIAIGVIGVVGTLRFQGMP